MQKSSALKTVLSKPLALPAVSDLSPVVIMPSMAVVMITEII